MSKRSRVRAAVAARRHQLATRVLIERDYRSFRRKHASIVGSSPPTTRGVALIASLTYSTFQAQREGMIAKALQFEGLEPVALVLPEARDARRYHEVFGIRRFVHLGDFMDDDSTEQAEQAGRELLARVSKPSDLMNLTFRGADVGREALSTVSRYLHEGGVDLDDPAAQALLNELLPTAVWTAIASERLLEALQPELVVFCERNYAEQAPLCDIALTRALNVVQFVGGFEDDTLVFKRYTAATKRLHPRSLSDETWELVKNVEWTSQRERALDEEFARRYDRSATFLARWNQGWTQERSRQEIVRSLGLDPSRKTAVVFSHVLWDANMFYGSDLFDDQEEWFVETVRAACENDRVNWIIKLHPANVWKLKRDRFEGELDELSAIREKVGSLPAHVHVLRPDTDISTWSLFDVTDWGITIRGSVGFELPCFGTPALTAGTGFYSDRGFTVDSDSPEQYLARLRAIEEIPPPSDEQVALARKHAYALFRLRQTRFTSFRTIFQPFERVDRLAEARLEVTVRSAAELARADDLLRLGDWAVNSRDLDYLEADPAGSDVLVRHDGSGDPGEPERGGRQGRSKT